MEAAPLCGAIGAVITAIDLTGDLDGETVAAIRRSWLQHRG